MAIQIGDRIWRTLAEPITVNGKTVKEVWENGVMVYPESVISGDLCKVRGQISLTNSHSHDDYRRTCSVTYSYTASFCAVYRNTKNVKDNFYDYINGNLDLWWKYYGTKSPELDHVSHQPDEYYPSYWSGITAEDVFISPLHDMNPIPTKFVLIKDGNTVVTEIKIKFNASPVPVCTPFKFPDWGSGYNDIEPYNRIYTASNGFESVEKYNGGYSLEFNGLNIGSSIPIVDVSGEHIRATAYNLTKSGQPAIGGYELNGEFGLDCDVLNYVTQETKHGKYLQTFTFALIPITEIMYIGDYDEAPEEMKHVSDSDLDF